MKYTGKLLIVDKEMPGSGRIYPKSVMEDAIKAMNEQIKEKKIYGLIEPSGLEYTNNLNSVSHTVDNLHLDENGEVWADIETIQTPQGRLADVMIGLNKCAFAARGFATLDENNPNVVKAYQIASVDLIQNSERTVPVESVKWYKRLWNWFKKLF